MTDEKDKRPDVAKDDDKTPREQAKETWHSPTETMDEGPAGSPDAEQQSRVS